MTKSFPKRRTSDLDENRVRLRRVQPAVGLVRHREGPELGAAVEAQPVLRAEQDGMARLPEGGRSEEPTSELQSLMRLSYSVFCLKLNPLNYIFILIFIFSSFFLSLFSFFFL